MANLPTVVVVKDEFKDAFSEVMSIFRGDQYGFSRGAIPADTPNPTPQSVPTHWFTFDGSTDDTDVAVLLGLGNGDLPPINEPGVVWGEDGVIGAADALEAISGENAQIMAVAGEVIPWNVCVGFLAGLGLIPVPEEEI